MENTNCSNLQGLQGNKSAIQKTAVRLFILHCKPEISIMLRAREIMLLKEFLKTFQKRTMTIEDYSN